MFVATLYAYSPLHARLHIRRYVNAAKDLKIRAGEWDTQTTKERLPYQERIVSRIFTHPNFNERSLAYDFVRAPPLPPLPFRSVLIAFEFVPQAIVELEDPFQMDRHINTVCLPPSGFVPYQSDCFASGWGEFAREVTNQPLAYR